MIYFNCVLLMADIVLVTTLIERLPYRWLTDKKKLDALYTEKVSVKDEIKYLKSQSDKDDDLIDAGYNYLFSVNMNINKLIAIPLIIQFVIVIMVLTWIKSFNPCYLWFVWFLGFSIVFNKMWSKLLR